MSHFMSLMLCWWCYRLRRSKVKQISVLLIHLLHLLSLFQNPPHLPLLHLFLQIDQYMLFTVFFFLPIITLFSRCLCPSFPQPFLPPLAVHPKPSPPFSGYTGSGAAGGVMLNNYLVFWASRESGAFQALFSLFSNPLFFICRVRGAGGDRRIATYRKEGLSGMKHSAQSRTIADQGRNIYILKFANRIPQICCKLTELSKWHRW